MNSLDVSGSWKGFRLTLPSGDTVNVASNGKFIRIRGKDLIPLEVELVDIMTKGPIPHHTLRPDIYYRPYGGGLDSVRARVEIELEQERTRELIDLEKDRLRRRRNRPWWQKLFPYTVSINRRDES